MDDMSGIPSLGIYQPLGELIVCPGVIMGICTGMGSCYCQ